MGRSYFGVLIGTDGKGQGFTTGAAVKEKNAQVVSLQAVQTAAIALEAAVSTSLIGSGTAGASAGVGWMSGTKLAALSASYVSLSGTIA